MPMTRDSVIYRSDGIANVRHIRRVFFFRRRVRTEERIRDAGRPGDRIGNH